MADGPRVRNAFRYCFILTQEASFDAERQQHRIEFQLAVVTLQRSAINVMNKIWMESTSFIFGLDLLAESIRKQPIQVLF